LEQFKRPWLKLCIEHTIDEESFDHEEFRASLMRNDMNFYEEKLQTKVTCRTGWLLGYHALMVDAIWPLTKALENDKAKDPTPGR
jgi:hypothetical protein